jgi:hypothetical protein
MGFFGSRFDQTAPNRAVGISSWIVQFSEAKKLQYVEHQRRKFPMLNWLPSSRKPSDTRAQVAQSTAEEKCEQFGNKNQSEDVLVQLRGLDCRRISLR